MYLVSFFIEKSRENFADVSCKCVVDLLVKIVEQVMDKGRGFEFLYFFDCLYFMHLDFGLLHVLFLT